MTIVFVVSLIIVLVLFICLELFRRYYTKHINKVFKGEETKKIPNFFILTRIVLVIATILLVIVPISWFSYSVFFEPTDDMRFGLYYEEDLHFEIEHNEVYHLPGVSYKFKVQMDILELTEAIIEGMVGEYDYYVKDTVVYIDMKTHYIKLTKIFDARYLKDMYILEFDYTSLYNETKGLFFYIPFPQTSIKQDEIIEYVSNDTYSIEVNEDWEFFKDYYQNLEDVVVENDVITLVATEHLQDDSEHYLINYTLELSYLDGKIIIEIIDISQDVIE